MFSDFLVHIIRDLFSNHNTPIYYGEDIFFLKTLRKPEHGVGAFLLHSNCNNGWNLLEDNNQYEISSDLCKGWAIELNDTFFGEDYCDLFMSINYNPWLFYRNYQFIAENLSKFMKKNGLVFLVNPGDWSAALGDKMKLREDLIIEAKRFSLLSNQRVIIYENI